MSKTRFASHPVLLVDDEPEILHSYKMTLRSRGITHILCCEDSREVMPLLAKEKISLILLDLSLPFISGEELLPMITEDFPDVPVIVITGKNDVATAVQCMKAKAFDYIIKPVERSRLVSMVRKAIEIRQLQAENSKLKDYLLSEEVKYPEAFSEIITKNKAMQALFGYVWAISESPQPLLITGETGVGKELMTKAAHALSRRHGPFVPVNVAGIDDHAFSDTLFGHLKGAFTGAHRVRRGLVEKASGGTLFLDEIGDLRPDSQIKLLRLLQEREYFPLGSDAPKTTDARIIVATNRQLHALQRSGRFRKDLYYRLKVHHFHIPPLRKRLDDLPLLITHFLGEASKSLGKKTPTYSEELITLLTNYHFPGNVRELKTMIYDAVSYHQSKTLSMNRFKTHIDQERNTRTPETKPHSPRGDKSFTGFESLPTLKQANRHLIAEAMKRSNNNQSMASRLLGISRQTLIRQLKVVDI